MPREFCGGNAGSSRGGPVLGELSGGNWMVVVARSPLARYGYDRAALAAPLYNYRL
jgi:hypothetical protein